ncbi:hypothetical protein AMELA_G00164370 [Ameiurus melas]|uniref:Immunoglobulin V-set domain-containing protein n=1 Tax=Ameiurus melas TaxID=219545 RepID=A0A7J6AFN8_AMEME|nr:hypothetical protein AMELA_G00164370 [Ameiurus melas]
MVLRDFKAIEKDITLFLPPFSGRPNDAPDHLQLELIELQCDANVTVGTNSSLLSTFTVSWTKAVPEFTVSGHVGSTAVLPCDLESEDTGTPHIRWDIGSEIVFERLGEETYQGEGYEGRVDVPEEELLKGNCSLVLRNLKLTDTAVYRSYLIVRRTNRSVMRKIVVISRVDLSVDGK